MKKSLSIRETLVLLVGDIAVFSLALWLSLGIRYGKIPTPDLVQSHALPFAILFCLSVFVFSVAGLYDKHTLVFRDKLSSLLIQTQVINSLLAVAFFYVVTFFDIAPKTVLAIYVVVSSSLIILWRVGIVGAFEVRHRKGAVLIGSGDEMRELEYEVNNNPRYPFRFVATIDLVDLTEKSYQVIEERLKHAVSPEASLVVMDINHDRAGQVTPLLQQYIFEGVAFATMDSVYEEVFDRIPLSSINYAWFLEHIPPVTESLYAMARRAGDVVVALIAGTISLVVYPWVALAIKIEDRGPVFIAQERIGQGGRIIRLWKFRSMKQSDQGSWVVPGDARITRVGAFLRRTRIDELPQLWSVLKGDISFIGPRPDILALGKELATQLPYYTIRNLVTPGLSGWAQVKQDLPPQSLEETRLRLSYDLYYIKNRSFILDLLIALKTIKVLLLRKGL